MKLPRQLGIVATFVVCGFANVEQSVIVFLRRARNARCVVVACNFTPVPRHDYRIGVPLPGRWIELLNSDAVDYGGSGQGNFGGLDATPIPCHGRPCSLLAVLPPLGMVTFASQTAAIGPGIPTL